MIKAVFIDIDNTLLDFDAYVRQTIKNGLRQFGLKPYDEEMFAVFERINNSLWAEIEQGKMDFCELERVRFSKIFSELKIDFDGPTFETYFRHCLWDNAIAVDGAPELLSYLKKKYVLCAASNGPFKQQCNRLSVAGMLEMFDDCFISEELGVSKPKTEFFEKALSRINENRTEPVLPGECVMIGDSLRSDIQGGSDAGMQTIWFNRKGQKNETGLQPDREVGSLKDIQKYL